MVKKLFIPVLIGSLLMNVPGFAPDSVKARLGFLGVCCVGLLVAVLYERQAATIVDGFEKLLDAIGDFIDERNNSLRLWISAVMFSGSLYATVTRVEHFVPFFVMITLICSFIWVIIEACVTVFAAYEARQKAKQEELRNKSSLRSYQLASIEPPAHLVNPPDKVRR